MLISPKDPSLQNALWSNRWVSPFRVDRANEATAWQAMCTSPEEDRCVLQIALLLSLVVTRPLLRVR